MKPIYNRIISDFNLKSVNIDVKFLINGRANPIFQISAMESVLYKKMSISNPHTYPLEADASIFYKGGHIIMVSSILIGFVVAAIAVALECELNYGFKEDEDGKKPFIGAVTESGWYKAIILGVVAGLARGTFAMGPTWATISFVLVFAATVYLAIWWWLDCDRFIEFLCLLALGAIFYWVLKGAAAAMVEFGLITGAFWVSVWQVLPRIVSLIVTGFMLITLCQRSYARTEKSWQRVLAWVFLVLYAFSLVYILVTDIDWKSIKTPKETVISATETPAPTETKTSTTATTTTVAATPKNTNAYPYYYNTLVFADDDPNNNWNFGPSPLLEILPAKIKDGKLTQAQVDAAKTDDQKVALVTPKDFDQNLRERMANDPALGAAVMAWFDANLGTRYLGVFYDECAGKWDATMNAAKTSWAKDQQDYNRTLASFFTFLDQATKVEVLKVENGLSDQMYQNPYTKDLVPDIIVKATTEKTGYFLRYTFDIKGEIRTVSYRIDCGYQPVNVAKVMNITPQPVTPAPVPTPAPTPKTSGGDGGKTSGGDGSKTSGGDGGKSSGGDPYYPPAPDPTPEPAPVPVQKDPTKGTVVPEDDNPGPGPDTNNGVGAQYSSKELPTNSAFDSYGEYQEEIKELVEINETQKVGGDSNKPSYTPPEPIPEASADNPIKAEDKQPVTVHNNGDKGTGDGGIDKETPEEEPVRVDSNLGGSGSTADDPVGQKWGGPPD